MALESSPDQTNKTVKHAMWHSGRRCSSGSSISLGDTSLEPGTSLDFSPHIRTGNLKKHGTLDGSMPRVHSAGRAADNLNEKAPQPDLINHAPEAADKSLQGNLCSSDFEDHVPYDKVPNGCVKKRLSDASIPSKLNIPGNSFVASDCPIPNVELYTAPTIATDKLRPYPPGLITIVKEGPTPIHESPSAVFLASVERDLEVLEGDRKLSSAMAPENIDHINGFEDNGYETRDCHCRITLEERLHAAFNEYSQLQQMVDFADSKCARWEMEAGEAAQNVATLRAKVSELEIELAARNASLHGLKAKVAQQFMENDDVNEKRRQFERDCKAQLAQLDSLKKSEEWYRQQLHSTQVERSSLQNQLITAQQNVVRQAHEVEKLRSDLKQTQNELVESKEKSLKDKKNFTLHLEKAIAFSSDAPCQEDPVALKLIEDGPAVQELKQRISDLEYSLTANNKTSTRNGEEIGRLLARNLQLQRELSETKIKLQDEQDRYTSAAQDREKIEAELKKRQRELSLLSGEHAALTVRLECQARDRAEQDDALQSLTRNFTNVSSRFNAMRAETQELRAQAEALRREARAAQAERDAVLARQGEAARRGQADAVSAKMAARQQADEARGREAALEQEVRALREAAECARPALQRLDDLQAERDQLAAHNEALRAQVDNLAQLLQQNTGSRLRQDGPPADQQAERDELRSQLQLAQAERGQLQVDNAQLRGQVQRGGARLAELSNTIQALEAEMAELRAQRVASEADEAQPHATEAEGEADQHSPVRQAREALETAVEGLEAEKLAALAAQAGLEAEVARLVAENGQLQRAKHDLAARVDELGQWLDTVTQNLDLSERGRAAERLARLSTSPVSVEAAEVAQPAQPVAEAPLRALEDANSELTRYAAALQRRLDRLENGRLGLDQQGAEARPPPDLVSTSEGGMPFAQDGVDGDADARGLAALLDVCLHRVGKAGLGGDAVRRRVVRLAASLTASPASLASPAPPEAEAAAADAVRSEADAWARLEALQEEHRDLKDREGRRDDLVCALLARLKDQVLARKEAERKLLALTRLARAPCAPHAPEDAPAPAPAAGDGLAGGERESERQRLEQELADAQAAVTELHLQLFGERRDVSQLRKEVSSLRLGLDTANDMLDSNKVALGRSEALGQVLTVSKDQLQERFEREQREHEDCRLRLERLQEQLQDARAKDPVLEAQIKTLGVHLHQRSGEARALQGRLALRDEECAALRAQLERQRAAARRDYDALRAEFSDALKKMHSGVPDPAPCDEEGLAALIQQSDRLSPAVLDDLKALLHNLKAELRSVEEEVGCPVPTAGPGVQHI